MNPGQVFNRGPVEDTQGDVDVLQICENGVKGGEMIYNDKKGGEDMYTGRCVDDFGYGAGRLHCCPPFVTCHSTQPRVAYYYMSGAPNTPQLSLVGVAYTPSCGPSAPFLTFRRRNDGDVARLAADVVDDGALHHGHNKVRAFAPDLVGNTLKLVEEHRAAATLDCGTRQQEKMSSKKKIVNS